MNIETVKSLFCSLSEENNPEKYAPFFALADIEIEKLLLPDADSSDERLNFLAAALVNFRVQQIKYASDRQKITYAGKMLSDEKGSSLSVARDILKDYLAMCSGLIAPTGLVFFSF